MIFDYPELDFRHSLRELRLDFSVEGVECFHDWAGCLPNIIKMLMDDTSSGQ